MAKKRYIKPEIREDSHVLTVRAWVTTVSQSLQVATDSNTSVAAQTLAEKITTTSLAVQAAASKVLARKPPKP